MAVTPEKVKSLLSTFLASSKQQASSKSIVPNAESQCQVEAESAASRAHQSTPTKAGTGSLRSYESFLERLDTFSSLTWFGKPTELSPLICARFGWANVETENLQCVGCKAYLCGKLPDHSEGDAYKVFKEKLKKDMLAAHDKFCVLAANPCPESFCLVPCDDPTSLISGFTDRVSSMELITSNLPNIDYSTLHSLNYDEGQGAAYCKRLLLPDSDTAPEVVALSLTGWSCVGLSYNLICFGWDLKQKQTKDDDRTLCPFLLPGPSLYSLLNWSSKENILMCSRCRRNIGLWNFDKPLDHSFHSSENLEQSDEVTEPASKMPKIKVKSSFNPVEEHKHWCPWLLPTSSSSSSASSASPSTGGKRTREGVSSSLPAFIQALKTMAPGLMDNNTGLAQAMKVSPMTDGLRCFRRVMKAWSSPKAATESSASESPSTRVSTSTSAPPHTACASS